MIVTLYFVRCVVSVLATGDPVADVTAALLSTGYLSDVSVMWSLMSAAIYDYHLRRLTSYVDPGVDLVGPVFE